MWNDEMLNSVQFKYIPGIRIYTSNVIEKTFFLECMVENRRFSVCCSIQFLLLSIHKYLSTWTIYNTFIYKIGGSMNIHLDMW